MQDTGETQNGSAGRDSSIRRFGKGAAFGLLMGGAIFMGGAATLITASAHSGSVTATESCTGWSASVSLNKNVTIDRNVDVVSTIPGTTGFEDHHFDTSAGQIWSAQGSSPASGTISLIIHLADDVTQEAGPPSAGYSVTLSAPTGCTAAITTNQSAGGTVGTALSDTATVTGTAGSPAGTVSFSLFPPSDATCTGETTVFTSTITLTSVTPGVSTADSGTYPSAGVGTFHWMATYNPTGNTYKTVTSACGDEPVTISQAGPSIATSASAGGLVPVSVTDTATVSGGNSPTGSVTFVLYPDLASCNAGTLAMHTSPPVALSGGKATSDPFTLVAVGTYQWVATYSGDPNNATVSSKCGDEPVITTTTTGGVQGIAIPSTGDAGALTGITAGGFLLLGGLGLGLMSAVMPRRRRNR